MESDRVLSSIPQDTTRTETLGARRQPMAPTGSQTLAWQRELAQAQAEGFAGWFSPVDVPSRRSVVATAHDGTAATTATTTAGTRIDGVTSSNSSAVTAATGTSSHSLNKASGRGGSHAPYSAGFSAGTASSGYRASPLDTVVALHFAAK